MQESGEAGGSLLAKGSCLYRASQIVDREHVKVWGCSLVNVGGTSWLHRKAPLHPKNIFPSGG